MGRLAKAVLASVRETIEREAGPEITYVEEPGAENPFLVYARAGEACPRCRRAKLERLVQAGRATFLCPRCQGRPGPRARKGSRGGAGRR